MAILRMSAVYVELNRLLDPIIREHLKFSVVPMTECWTVEHRCNWQIENKKDIRHAGGSGYEPIYGVEHEQSLYFASGHFKLTEAEQGWPELEKVEIRAVCELSEWVPVGQHVWTLRIWIRRLDGEISKHCFEKYSFCASVNALEVPESMRDLPPKKISFKNKEVVAA